MKGFIEELKALGFGTDDEINGGDVVDCINTHFNRLKKSARALEYLREENRHLRKVEKQNQRFHELATKLLAGSD